MAGLQLTGLFGVDLKNMEDLDTYHLLLLFPEEIWKVILKNVRDLKNLESLSNASLFFRERLLSRRKTYLFPGVFECLINFLQKDDQAFGDNITNLDRVTETEEKVLEFSLILRLVCLEWNKAIEDYIQAPSINLFITSKRYVQCDCAAQMLVKFGPMLKSVYLGLRMVNRKTLAEYYLEFIKMLMYLPRVKELEIKGYSDSYSNIQIAETTERYPCPQMKELEYLVVTDFFPSQILKEFLRQNNMFSRLRLFSDYVGDLTFDFSTPLPYLEHLHVCIRVEQDFQKLKLYAKNWKLVTFTGMFWHFSERISWLEIFKMIADNWGNTLETLGLDLAKHRLNPAGREMVLSITKYERLNNLKSIKRIEIRCDSAICLDFLLPCHETLEVMTVCQWGNVTRTNPENPYYNDFKDRQIVEYLGKETSMEDSNLWNLFPKLQSFHSRETNLKRPAKYY